MTRALVTGGGTGIGRAIALELSRRGCEVAILGRTEPALAETAKAILRTGGHVLAVPCDVTKSAEVDAARERIVRELGPIDVLVNNAGVVRRAAVREMSEDDWDAVVDTNLKGTFLVSRTFLPNMLAQRRGRCIAIASISSTLGTPRLSAYCASKWGVVGFIKSLAEELRGTGVQALSVLPGSVDTAMLAGSGFSPAMQPDDVARTVAFAALDAPDAMNGASLEIFGP